MLPEEICLRLAAGIWLPRLAGHHDQQHGGRAQHGQRGRELGRRLRVDPLRVVQRDRDRGALVERRAKRGGQARVGARDLRPALRPGQLSQQLVGGAAPGAIGDQPAEAGQLLKRAQQQRCLADSGPALNDHALPCSRGSGHGAGRDLAKLGPAADEAPVPLLSRRGWRIAGEPRRAGDFLSPERHPAPGACRWPVVAR